jgi:hypothetical protein
VSQEAKRAPPAPSAGPPSAFHRSGPSPLLLIAFVLIAVGATLLWVLSRPHRGPSVVVAVAQRSVPAFSLLAPSDVRLVIRTDGRAYAWSSIEVGPVLLLQSVHAGEVVRPDEILALNGIAMPRRAVIIGVKLTNSLSGDFEAGQQVEILGEARHPVRVPAIFLASDGARQAILAVSRRDSDRFGPMLSSALVSLVRPLSP